MRDAVPGGAPSRAFSRSHAELDTWQGKFFSAHAENVQTKDVRGVQLDALQQKLLNIFGRESPYTIPTGWRETEIRAFQGT